MLQTSSLNNNNYYNNNNNNNNVSSNNNFTNNNNNYTHERNTHSGNMYSYREDSINEPPKESNAIRRSIGANYNQNINPPYSHDISRKNKPKYLEQFPDSYNKNDSKRNKNHILGQSSEMRIPPPEHIAILNKVPELDETKKNKLYGRRRNQNNGYSYLITYIIIGALHVIMILLIGLFFEFKIEEDDNVKYNYIYIFFKDIHMFIFVGFGFLYAALRDHQWTSLLLVLILGTLAIEFSFFYYYFWANTFSTENWQKINIDFSILSGIEYNAASALITLGALLGKLSLIQYVIIIFFETFFGSLNFFLCYEKLKVVDNGGSLFIHSFGAIFGLGVSCVLYCVDSEFLKINNNPHMTSNYYSNMFGIIGSIFLWLFFPSFNVANIQSQFFSILSTNFNLKGVNFITENLRYRGIINTYLSMIGSLLSSFIISPLFYQGKLKMEHLLHASYVGGIVIGGCCTICSSPWSAVVIGFCGGTITILLLWKIKHMLHGIKCEDSIGVLEIFGIPGLMGGIFTCIFLGNMSYTKFWEKEAMEKIFGGSRRPAVQAGLQISAIFVTLGISAISGVVTGFVAKVMTCVKINKYFVDSEFFMEEEGIILPEYEYQDESEKESKLDSSGNKLDEEGREVNVNNNNVNRHIDSGISNNKNNNNNESENDENNIDNNMT